MQHQPLGHTPPSFPHPSAVIPAVFKRESILDYAGVNPAYAMLQDAQFGYLYPFTDYHKHLLFCDLPLSTAK